MGLQLHVDFSGDDWVGFQRASDSPNRWGAVAVNTADLQRYVSSGGGSATTGSHARYSADRAKYGKGYVRWTTSTGGAAAIRLGWDGASAFNTVAETTPNGTYTIVLWAKISGGGGSDTFRLNAGRDAGTGVASGTSQTISETAWTKFKTTFVYTATAGNDQIWMELQRTAGSSNLVIDITGAMFYAGSGDQWLNCGTASLAEDITSYWMGGKFGLGFVKPYQYVAPVGKANLTLNNKSKRFSPEYTSGPLYGDLLPNLLVQIGDPDYGVWWTGWTDSWEPEPGQYRDTNATLKATDARRFLDKPLALLPLQESTAANTLVSTFMLPTLVPMPNTTLGIPAASGVAVAWDAAATETVPYYGDGNGETDPVSKIVGDVVGGVQGKFWMNRNGQYQHTAGQGDDTPSSYVDIAQKWRDIGYGSGMIVNDSHAKIYIRKTSAGVTLWELDAAYSLAVGDEEVERVFFRDSAEGSQITGARSSTVGISSGTTGGSIAVVITSLGAQSALISAENFAGGTGTVDTITVTGTAVIAKKTVEKSYEDSASKTANGLQTETLDFNWVQSRPWAKRLARYRVNRFKDARNEVPWVELDADRYPSEAFNSWVGAAVHVEDDQTDHDDYYAVIGEQHTIKEGLVDHTVKLYLEPLYATTVANTSV